MYMLVTQYFLLLSVVTLCCFRPVTCQTPQLHPDEKVVLKKMAATMGAKSLNLSVDPCQSQMLMITAGQPNNDSQNNITCTVIGNFYHITNLTLKRLSLPGRLPSELVNLKFLEKIDVAHNYFSGTLPIEWATMRNLKFISLVANNLSGEIPKEWGNFTSLTFLSLEANRLSGSIPLELGNLLYLTVLILSSNYFVGSLPPTLANLSNLAFFGISDNSFNGTVPGFIGNWTNLERLEMYASGLTGPIPDAIFHLENLRDLRITDMNGIEFNFPTLTNKDMKNLVLRNVNLSGSIPEDIWGMRYLDMLDVSFNNLRGVIYTSEVPPEIVFLSDNMLTGEVPESFLSTGRNLDLSYNNFILTSSPPESRTINMYRSTFWKNNSLFPWLSGSICPTYYRSIHINCGGPNVTITNRHKKIIYEGDEDAENGAALSYISRKNWGLISTGDFMDDDGRNDHEYTLTNSSKLLDNNSESELYTTARVAPMYLTYYGYCLTNGMYTVNLHFAEILFRDEESYSRLGRRIFDIYIQGELVWKDFNIKEDANGTNKPVTKAFNAAVRENTLEIRLYWAGKGTTVIPSRGFYGPLISAISVRSVIEEFKAVAIREKTLEIRFYWAGKGTIAAPKRGIYGPLKSAISVEVGKFNVMHKAFGPLDGGKRKIFIVAGVLFSAAGFSAVVIVLMCALKRKLLPAKLVILWKKRTTNDQIEAFIKSYGTLTPKRYNYSDVKKMTKSFTDKLGQGGYGGVYKGKLLDGRPVAVKILSELKGNGEDFINEVASISRTSHVNIVTLVGFCYERTKRALIYEFMPNGSLDKFIYDKESSHTCRNLQWETLYQITIGIAQGLEYLHRGCSTRIVHFDIKPHNILLDEHFCPKISDFGLAKLCRRDESIVSMLGARGTAGYIAPEVFCRNFGGVSHKSDVYSYGMMVLEMVGGRKNINVGVSATSEIYFPHWIYKQLELGKDLTLHGDVTEQEEETARKMIIVSLWCIQINPSDRPSMTKVLNMLDGSLQSLQIPPMPILSSPRKSPQHSCTTSSSAP